jgi:hypothetical protein
VFHELAMPMTGLPAKSPSQYPIDFHNARAPAFGAPAKTSELLHLSAMNGTPREKFNTSAS